jgi:hypothetical protein
MIWKTRLTQALNTTTTRTTEGTEIAATGNVSYKTMQSSFLGLTLLDPTFSISGRLGKVGTGETIETPLDLTKSSADRLDWTISAKFRTDIGFTPKKK